VTSYQRQGKPITFVDANRMAMYPALWDPTNPSTAMGMAGDGSGVHPLGDAHRNAIAQAAFRGVLDVTAGALGTSVPPSPPSGMTAVANGAGLDVAWTTNSLNEQFFDLDWSTNSDFTGATTTSLAAGTTGTTLAGLPASTLVYVRVRARNTGGSSWYAPPAVATTATGLSSQTLSGFNAFPAHTYGDAPFTITSVTGGSSGQAVTFSSNNLAVATVSGTTVTITGAGTATITANQAAYTNFAAATPVSQTLTVAQAALSITAANASRVFGAVNPIFDGTILGVVNGDTITATYASSANATTAAGVYGPATPEAITPTPIDLGARLGNYLLTSTNGTLTITSPSTPLSTITVSSDGSGGGCGLGGATGLVFCALLLFGLRHHRRPL